MLTRNPAGKADATVSRGIPPVFYGPMAWRENGQSHRFRGSSGPGCSSSVVLADSSPGSQRSQTAAKNRRSVRRARQRCSLTISTCRWCSNASQIDARQKKLCDNAKAANTTTLYGAGEHRQRSDLPRTANIGERHRQVLSGDAGRSDCPGGRTSARRYRSCAWRAETDAATNKKARLLEPGS
jgi:hypothetical protein